MRCTSKALLLTGLTYFGFAQTLYLFATPGLRYRCEERLGHAMVWSSGDFQTSGSLSGNFELLWVYLGTDFGVIFLHIWFSLCGGRWCKWTVRGQAMPMTCFGAMVTKRPVMGLAPDCKVDSRGCKLTAHGLILVSRPILTGPQVFDIFYKWIANIYKWGYFISNLDFQLLLKIQSLWTHWASVFTLSVVNRRGGVPSLQRSPESSPPPPSFLCYFSLHPTCFRHWSHPPGPWEFWACNPYSVCCTENSCCLDPVFLGGHPGSSCLSFVPW